jgi:hypothetical protein
MASITRYEKRTNDVKEKMPDGLTIDFVAQRTPDSILSRPFPLRCPPLKRLA